MGSMMIDGRRVEFTDEPNVLAVIRKAGIDIPTLCYHSELSIYGACRLCTVEMGKDVCFLFRKTEGRNGHLYEYTKTDKIQKADYRIAFSIALQRLYNLYQEWGMSSPGSCTQAGSARCPI